MQKNLFATFNFKSKVQGHFFKKIIGFDFQRGSKNKYGYYIRCYINFLEIDSCPTNYKVLKLLGVRHQKIIASRCQLNYHVLTIKNINIYKSYKLWTRFLVVNVREHSKYVNI